MLHDLQASFADSVMRGDVAAASRIRAGSLTAEKRLAIYRHSVFATLRGALADLYPVVQRIVGGATSARLADAFIRDTPSASGDLNDFGGEWAEYLAAHPVAQDLPYLQDVARLEWAWHRAFHAADADVFDLARLAHVDAARHGDIVFALHPSVSLLASAYPLLRIHEVNQPDYNGDMLVDWRVGDQVIIARDGMAVVMRALDAGQAAFLRALADGQVLANAADAAIAADAAFDLQRTLIDAVQSSIIVDASVDGVALRT